MSKILCIETASTNCSVALGINGKIIAVKEDFNDNYSHAERLHVFIEALLLENDTCLQEMDAFAVSKGPGSYTGLRIGVSSAKGFAYALGKKLISIPTLQSLALQVNSGDFIVPMLDARRMEVYTSVYKDHKLVEETTAKILDEYSYVQYLEQGMVHFIGSGVEKFSKICTHPNAKFITGRLPSAREMVYFAEEKMKISDTEDVAYFEPFYLKNFIAG